MVKHVTLLIIGAGPSGLAMAAYAKHCKMDHLVVGKPMDFWKSNMPKGMFLRSPVDWHIDPLNVHTIANFVQTQDLNNDEIEPIPINLFLRYAKWFQEEKDIEVLPSLANRLDWSNKEFKAVLDSNETIIAQNVLIAPGFRYFKNMPEGYTKILPPGRFSHSCELVNLESLIGKKCLIIGGRQSAFEWGALATEKGAATVHISYRHETPEFKQSDWSWVKELVSFAITTPGWFRRLPKEQKEDMQHHFWAEGRMKLEPWLLPRIKKETIKLWPNSLVIECHKGPNGEFKVKLDVGETLTVDYVLLATGYEVNISRVPYLASGNILEKLNTKNGYPALDDYFQSNLPGLFFNGSPAMQDFGPFFGFILGSPVAAKIIGSYISSQLAN